MRIIILGAGGLLGRHLGEELGRQKRHEVVSLTRKECDISSSFAELRDRTAGADVLINCAAFTNVDGAEADEAGAYRANALGAEHVALAARAHGSLCLHVSTDFVFGGEKTEPYDEFDRPHPLSVYGRSKWAGEELVLLSGARAIIARVQGLYGAGGTNFSSKLADLIAAQKPLKLDRQRKVQPSWARAVARQLIAIVERPAAQIPQQEIFHVSCKGQASWAEAARFMADKLNVKPNWEEIETASLKAPAARPANCLFRHRNLGLRGIDVLPTWQEAMSEYLDERKKALSAT